MDSFQLEIKAVSPPPPSSPPLSHEQSPPSSPRLSERTSSSLSPLQGSTTTTTTTTQVKSHSHHKITRVLISSCVPLGLVLFLLIFFTSTSESASLSPSANAQVTGSSSSSSNNPGSRISSSGRSSFVNDNTQSDHSRNSRSSHVPHSSYIFQIPYSYHHQPSSRGQRPRVLVRLSSESGILQPQAVPTTTTTTTTTSPNINQPNTYHHHQDPATRDPSSNQEDEGGEAEISTEDQDDYPYQFYLDFDENLSQQNSHHSNSKDKSELLPLPSENYRTQQYQNPHQNNIWSDFLSHVTPPTTTTTTTTPSTTPSLPNPETEPGSDDTYTIPSLKDYKFPKFKISTATTIKPLISPIPKKRDHLSPYEFFSEEDLENVADLEDDHSKYFVKTKPRDVSSSVANLYNSFYYEPPSYSTKTQPLPVKAKFPLAEVVVDETDKLVYLYSNHGQGNSQMSNEDPSLLLPQLTSPMTPTTTSTTTTETLFTTPPPPILNTSSLPNNIHNYETKHDSSTAESLISSRSINQVVTPSTLSFPTGPPTLNQIPSDNQDDITSKLSQQPQTMTTTTDATSIPGIPGIDYPIFDEIPQTSFDCQNQRYKGFFADTDTKCQAWHYCDFTDGHSTFLCPNGTLFSQVLLTCDWWFNVDCNQAHQLYVLNERLYRYIKPPKPSFPEDYHGPQVDKWLLKQLELGLLPKIKKKGNKPLVEKPSTSTTPSPTQDDKN